MARLRLAHSRDDPGLSRMAQPPVMHLSLSGLAIGARSILGAIDLSLRPGETVALTGPSGIGKTTLLRCIAGLETRYSGQIDAPDRLSVVFQEPTLMPWRSLHDNLCIPLGIDRGRAEQALSEVGLAGRGSEFPNRLSLGQQRRLSLARAFAAAPDLMLMDEPFVSLDPQLAHEMMSLFETLRTRHPVATLLVTHAWSEAERLADRYVRLDGQPASIREEGAISR